MQTSKIEHLQIIKESLLLKKSNNNRALTDLLRQKHVYQDEIDSFNKQLANIDELVNAIEEEL